MATIEPIVASTKAKPSNHHWSWVCRGRVKLAQRGARRVHYKTKGRISGFVPSCATGLDEKYHHDTQRRFQKRIPPGTRCVPTTPCRGENSKMATSINARCPSLSRPKSGVVYRKFLLYRKFALSRPVIEKNPWISVSGPKNRYGPLSDSTICLACAQRKGNERGPSYSPPMTGAIRTADLSIACGTLSSPRAQR